MNEFVRVRFIEPATKVASAVSSAADIQRRLFAFNAEASESLDVQIGIHAGEPVEEP
jgi:class 3 adenylate cyclase